MREGHIRVLLVNLNGLRDTTHAEKIYTFN